MFLTIHLYNSIIHFNLKNIKLKKDDFFEIERCSSGDRSLNNGFVFINCDLNLIGDLNPIEQRKFMFSIFIAGIKYFAKQFDLNVSFEDFDRAASIYQENGYRVVTRRKKHARMFYYMSLERNISAPIICRLHYQMLNNENIEEFVIDEIDDPRQPSIFFPEVKIKWPIITFQYWQRKIVFNCETKESEYIPQPIDRLENILFW